MTTTEKLMNVLEAAEEADLKSIAIVKVYKDKVGHIQYEDFRELVLENKIDFKTEPVEGAEWHCIKLCAFFGIDWISYTDEEKAESLAIALRIGKYHG